MNHENNDRTYRNYLAEIGFSEAEVSARLDEWFDQMFTVGTPQCIYGEDRVGGYLIDTGNDDVRTEGQSYGMMMAVQRNRQDIFDKIWAWTKRYMWHSEGQYVGYFAWSCDLDGTHRAEGPAPDGEEYFAMALFFASHRWGDREAPFDYSVQARDILHHCVHQKELTGGEGDPMWDPNNYQIRFVPEAEWTDPSYHLPHFYDLFALWANEEDRPFWKKAAEASRRLIPMSAHPVTGLTPEYSEYDGSPKVSPWGMGSSFYSDAYRVMLNIALDTVWNGGCEAYETMATNEQNFFAGIGFDNTKFMDYRLDGSVNKVRPFRQPDAEPMERPALHPVGLGATIAAASICSHSQSREAWMRLFWNTPLRVDKRRYFDSDLCYFALLMLSGQYRVW